MDIGIVISQLSGYGGAEIFLLECLKRWQDEVKITLYTPSLRKKLLVEHGIQTSKIDIVRLPRLQQRKRFRLVDELVLEAGLWEKHIGRHDVHFVLMTPVQFLRRRPCVWLAHEPLRMLYDLRYLSYGRNGVAHIYPKTQYESLDRDELELTLPLLEACTETVKVDYLVTSSEKSSRYLETVYGRKADLVVYPGVDTQESISPPSASRKAIFVGRLWKHKRVDLLVQAMAHVPEGELVIVGDGPERTNLQELAEELGVASQVSFKGDVSAEEKARLYADATCGVYTPISEPFGMMPLEAAAAGRPSVVTVGGGYCEVLNEESAFFVSSEPERIATAIREIFTNRDLAQRMGKAAWNCARQYTWEKTSQVLLEFLGKVHATHQEASVRSEPPRFGAFYYPWYQDGEPARHWNENSDFAAVQDFPVGGPYSSADPATISRHIEVALEAGLDLLVVDWEIGFEGLHPAALQATENLFQAVEDSSAPLSIAVSINVQTEDFLMVRKYLTILREEFVSRKAYCKIRDQPPVWYFLDSAFFAVFYHNHKELERLNAGFNPVAAGAVLFRHSVERRMREFFKGWGLYSPLQVSEPDSWRSAWTTNYENFREAAGEDALRVFGICPGYDDTQLSTVSRRDESFRKIPREDSKTYQMMQEVALGLDPLPDIVVVTSFNEFHENTHIEPSAAHGDLYVKASQSFKQRLLAAAGKSRARMKGA